MYVSDAAECIVQALEKYENSSSPINIGTGKDITIKGLVDHIVDAIGYDGDVFWNEDKPDGQLKKLLNPSKMKEIIQIDPTNIREGLRKTIDWYTNNKEKADSRK